jgi:hypothetical protein
MHQLRNGAIFALLIDRRIVSSALAENHRLVYEYGTHPPQSVEPVDQESDDQPITS